MKDLLFSFFINCDSGITKRLQSQNLNLGCEEEARSTPDVTPLPRCQTPVYNELNPILIALVLLFHSIKGGFSFNFPDGC